ncbi:MAG: MATE family efflux transporter [Spirochaetota bacterium]|nr:MATE family efflux transporter [Spirochaetota bacterium]
MFENTLKNIKRRWECEGGYRELLTMAIPLILTTSMWSIQHFVDRMFLTWYSPEAIAAAMPAGILNFTIISLFMGTASYVNTFVAQYYGATIYDKIGPIIWQGLYIAIIGGIIHLLLIPFAGTFFNLIGHQQEVQRLEIIYFQVLCLGATPLIASSVMAGFFSGRGKTWIIMWINIIATCINICLNYCLIFGKLFFPELGVKGAAIATVLSSCFSFLSYIILLCRKSHNMRYHTLKGWMFNKILFRRLIHFGLPNGIQFFLDIAGFSAFILLIGRLGTTPLAATNIAFNINTLAFMPMLGFGITVSILVGQYLGKKNPLLAERSAYSGLHFTFLYMLCIALAYVIVPEIFISPFASQADPNRFEPIRKITLILLRFLAIFSIFDTLNIIFASAIKGAGDTRFVMYMIVIISSTVLIIPSYIAMTYFDAGIYAAWTIASLYAIILGFAFMFRFLGGKWKSMRVIEENLITSQEILPEN